MYFNLINTYTTSYLGDSEDQHNTNKMNNKSNGTLNKQQKEHQYMKYEIKYLF